ncbi:hypothetical protein HanOQP8_Chr11g0396801 [Helianthus annuus]|nr:hypothetical protein HanHA89_Chr11g0416941 [Helianthus annuus]KAJ0684721.1 hypothetical protein HanLR1_Chr11g0394331 [Helianthus annuus]KAJ0688664.1 hypothetical protein HanOQP8_Chr11g0396801 [Helianthus annuus]
MNIQTKSFSVVGLSWCSHRYHCSCLFSLQSPFSSGTLRFFYSLPNLSSLMLKYC